MEEDVNGSNNSISTTGNTNSSSSMDGKNPRSTLEVDQRSSEHPIKPSQKIITDCC